MTWFDENKPVYRVSLILLAIGQAPAGIWALVSPRSFYDDFPVSGRDWVSSLGPYNEHLARDAGAGLLAAAVVVALAAVWLERRVVQVALVAWLVFAIPHLAYHLTTLDEFGTGDDIGNLVTLGLTVLVPLPLLIGTWRPAQERAKEV
jgi:hypothetical protein